MSARNRSEQLEARALAKRLAISYVDALARIRTLGMLHASERLRLVQSLDTLAGGISRESRRWIFRHQLEHEKLTFGDFAGLSDEALESAVAHAECELQSPLDRAVTLARTWREQFDAAVARERVTGVGRLKLDASPVLRSGHIGIYTRWSGGLLELHLDELGRVDSGDALQRTDAVRQFESAEVNAIIDYAQGTLEADTVMLKLSDTPELVALLESRGWRNDRKGALVVEDQDVRELHERNPTLVRRSHAAEAEWAALMAVPLVRRNASASHH